MCSSTKFHFMKLEKEPSMGEGIVSILRSDDCKSAASPAAKSLRRTLSADMSSKKWLAHNYSPMKRIASSEELLAIAGAGEEDESEIPGQDEVWRSIQAQKKGDGDGSWGSILVEKNEPYSPGLLRSSGSSCLSEKSLEICTESLGSETGSDGFSPSEETGDIVEEHLRVMKYCKKAAARGAFPPLLPSLAREDGGSLQMQPRRENGRLVLEAVSVASHAYFQAHREHGRLRLSLPDEIGDVDDEVFDAEFEESSCEEYSEINEIMGGGGGGGIMQKPPIMVKKVMGLDTKNLVWSSRLNKGLNLLDHDASIPLPLPHSLPPLIPNAYDYFWRLEKKPATAAAKNQSPPLKTATQNLVLVKGNKPELVPSLRRSCNESRRTSLLLWEPHCIAT